MLILILAANTSFADFPRLANFHATDNFMPRQLTKRGHRLVFSNGIVGLAIAATVLVVVFQADVHRLIPLYAIGVFTSFTLSQAGMARRHLRIKEPGWRHGLAINGLGAVTTAVVTVIIAFTKFTHGAWAVMVFVPVMVWLLVRMNHQYEREHEELDEDLPPFDAAGIGRPIAAGRGRGPRSQDGARAPVRQDHAGPERAGGALRDGGGIVEGVGAPVAGARASASRSRSSATTATWPAAWPATSARCPDDADVNVIIPGPAHMGPFERLRRGRLGAHLARALLPYDRVRITLVRDHAGPGHVLTGNCGRPPQLRVLPRGRTIGSSFRWTGSDRAALRAVRYALGLGATEVRAVHAAVDQDNQEQLMRRWMELGIPVELDVIECWDRNVARSLERYVVELMGRNSEVTVVMPRRDYARLRYRLLHDRTSRKIARALGRYEHVDLAAVPYYFGKRRASGGVGRLT